MKRVLLTGAAGDIGRAPAQAPEAGLSGPAAERHQEAGRSRAPTRRSSPPTSPSIDEVEKIVDGIDGIIHLGGFSVEGPWETILQSNIIGCYNLFEAARAQGRQARGVRLLQPCGRLLSAHHHIGVDVTVRPDSRYGVSKAFGEALGALYADKHGCACCACASATSATSRSTSAGCRSGSGPRTSCS